MLRDFKFDLNMIAPAHHRWFLDQRHHRHLRPYPREPGRLSTLSPSWINNAVNQTLSRTIITSVDRLPYRGGDVRRWRRRYPRLLLCDGRGHDHRYVQHVMIASPMLFHPRFMWVTAIVLGGGTALLIASAIDSSYLRIPLMVVIVAGSLYAWSSSGQPRQVRRFRRLTPRPHRRERLPILRVKKGRGPGLAPSSCAPAGGEATGRHAVSRFMSVRGASKPIGIAKSVKMVRSQQAEYQRPGQPQRSGRRDLTRSKSSG